MLARTLALAALLATPLLGWAQRTLPQPETIAAPSSDAAPKLTQVTYSVADLVVPIPGLDYPQDAVNQKEEQAKTKEAWLMDKIISTVAANTWQELGGAGSIQYYPLGVAVVVKQTPEIQAQVADLLATMRRVQNVQVAVEMRLVTLSNRYLAKLRRLNPTMTSNEQWFLNDKELWALLEKAQGDKNLRVLHMPRHTLCSGQRCVSGITDVLEYKLGVMMAADLRYVRIDVKAEFPEINVKLEKVANLADGTTLVLPVRIDNERQLLYMVTARFIINLSENVIAPMLPRRVFQTSPPNKVVQASAAEVIAPPPSAPAGKVRQKQIAFDVCVSEGDPLGSREANTVRTLVDSSVATLENQTFIMHGGGKATPPVADIGSDGDYHPRPMFVRQSTMIKGTPGIVKDGSVSLDLTISKSVVNDETGNRVQVQTESTQTIMTLKLGEVSRVRLGKATDDIQRWVEITATEVGNTMFPLREVGR